MCDAVRPLRRIRPHAFTSATRNRTRAVGKRAGSSCTNWPGGMFRPATSSGSKQWAHELYDEIDDGDVDAMHTAIQPDDEFSLRQAFATSAVISDCSQRSADLFFEISFKRDSYRILLLSHRQCRARLDAVLFARATPKCRFEKSGSVVQCSMMDSHLTILTCAHE